MSILTEPNSRYHGGHGLDQWQGDCGRAIRRAALRPRRRRLIDLNVQPTADGEAMLHSRTPRVNGYRYIQEAGGRRPMTREELDRPSEEWLSKDVVRWRRTARAGLSYESRVRPLLFAEACRRCARWRVRLCAEWKSPKLANPVRANRMRRLATLAGAVVYAMTLVTMPGWREKLRAAKQAGFPTALLAHGAPRPADLTEQRPFIDTIWGHFA